MELFSQITRNLSIKTIAIPGEPTKDCFIVKNDLPAFDSLELLEKYPCLQTEEGLIVTRAQMMKRPIRILFFMLSIEIEYSLYKILKQYVLSPGDLENLRSLFLNDLIRKFFELEEPFKLQNLYTSKQEMKKDLKAISSFRNIVMHSNRKMQLETEFKTILERKRQMLRLIDALEQIAKNIKIKRGRFD